METVSESSCVFSSTVLLLECHPDGVISREQVLKILVNGAIDNLPNGNRERIHWSRVEDEEGAVSLLSWSSW